MTKSSTINLPSTHDEGQRLPALSQDKVKELVDAFFADKSAQTQRAYRKDLQDFRTFLGADDITQAANTLLSQGNGNANYTALKYRQNMAERGLAPATINRRLASLRSMINLANFLGLVPWRLAIRGKKLQRYRDTRGPGLKAIQTMIVLAGQQANPRGARDVAILRLLFGLALRRGEVAALLISDVDLNRGLIAVKGKGRSEKEFLEIPPKVAESLSAWMDVRGTESGPMFKGISTGGNIGNVATTGNGIYNLVRQFGGLAGTLTRPHGLRHTAITEACRNANKIGLTIKDVKDFSRHADLKTLELYWDRTDSAQGKLAQMVDAAA